MRVLVVEDDAVPADALARSLRAERFAVAVATNGENGAQLGATEFYDAALP